MAGSGLEVVVGTPSEVSKESSQDSLDFFEGLVEVVSQMKAVRPDIVRGIPVYRVLQRMPRKWLAGERRKFYGLSEVASEHLDEFWSHSWRTMAWLKYVNILFLNNGFPAFVVAALCACAAFSAAVSGILPIQREPYQVSIAHAWCTIAGTLGYYVTLFLWKSRKMAFLDVACISQTDEALKGVGLISMGAFLRCSKSLLVLWDETWIMRMWCVFEMAGFLHSKGPCADKSVLVCPVFTGPALVLAHLGLSVLLLTLFCTGLPFYPWAGVFASAMLFPCLLLLARVVIHHCRSIDAIQCQVRHFTVQQCSCTCCGCGHMDANGSTMNCDRLIILRCISAWFGSVASFESLVRTRLLKALVYQLANQAFSYWRIVQAASPVAFAVLDLLYWHYPDKIVIVLEATLKSATYLFCVVPCLAQLLLRLAYRIRNLGHSKLAQWLLSAVLVAAASLLYGAYFFCESALRSLSSDTFGQFVPADLALLTVMGTATVALWRCMPAVEMIETPQDPAGGSEPASPTAPVFAAPGTSLSL